MRKYIKRLSAILLIAVFVSINTLDVFAGSVTLSFDGADTVKVNDTITLTVKASDISGLTNGLATAQGDIIFDSAYLEYSSFKAISSTLSVSYGAKAKRFVALGIGGEYVTSSDNLFSLTFKAKQVGQTKLNINNVVIGDTKAIIHSSNVLEKTINIVEGGNNNPPTDNKKPSTPSTGTTPPKRPSTGSSSNKKSNDNTLSSLVISDSKMSPSFHKNTTTYNVVVPLDIKKLDIKYVTSDKNAKVSISGADNLKDDEVNVVTVTVTAEDGSVKKYTLNVTKSNERNSNKLASLDIKESKVNFDKDKYEYSIKVGNDVKKLTIDAIPESKDSKVEILGNDKLAKGNNVVLIKLTDKNGFSTYYRVNVKKSNKVTLFGIDVKYIIIGLLLLLFFIIWILLLLLKRKKDEKEEEEEPIKVQLVDDDHSSREDDLYDDVVTKDELINAIEEKNPKKLKMLLTQDKVNKLKDELKEEEEDE